MRSMLSKYIVIILPLLWLTVTIVVLAACRAAAGADSSPTRPPLLSERWSGRTSV
jgi:hypothetical protein